MAFDVWDVAFVQFPNQEDASESTSRPAIVIEDLFDEVSICPITSQVHQQSHYKYTILVSAGSPEAIEMGLTFDSLIVLDRIEILKKIRLAFTIGTCPESIIDQIEDLLEQMRDDGLTV